MSFTWTAGMMNPEVVRGAVVVKDNVYKLGATQTFKQGELIRVTSAGTIVVGAVDSDTSGPVHGMALANAADYTAGDYFPVAIFDEDTELAIQLAASTDQNDVEVGEVVELEIVASNKWTATGTTTKGIAIIVSKESQGAWFDEKADATLDQGRILIRFSAANFDAFGAA